MPLGYLLTWNTYGTWLHGDARGSVDKVHNVYGEPFAPPNAARMEARFQQLKHEPLTLDAAAREVVRETIHAHCGIRKWKLFEVNARTNHVHAVVWAPLEPKPVMSQLKAWCTRRLREACIVSQDHTVWAEDGSRKYLWDEESLTRAREYVRNRQGPDI